jgi:hypothetical protein
MRIIVIAGIYCLAFLFVCTETDEANVSVVINEFMVRVTDSSAFTDCMGNHEDWVELHNTGDEAISMSRIYISDKADNLLKKRLHDTIIPGGGYYLLWGGDSMCVHNNHLGFSFNATDTVENEQIVISDGNGNIIDEYKYMEVPAARIQNKSYGRFPDGSDSWTQQVTATPGIPNEG